MNKTIIGVMGPGSGATAKDKSLAYELGSLIARKGWILLSGGRSEGVMEAVNEGAKSASGITIGILPGNSKEDASPFVDIAIVTDMGSARNNINVLSSDIVIACGTGVGTASEIALALKAGKNVILLSENMESKKFFESIAKDHVFIASDPKQAIEIATKLLNK
jgi:uncharacterized protein (TIGR00725 family)